MKTETPEQIKAEREVLRKNVGEAQKRHIESERVIRLLIAAGFVSEDKVDQARELASDLR